MNICSKNVLRKREFLIKGKEKDAGNNPKVKWKILENNISTFNPTTEKCQLCIREKIYIVLKPHLCTLNSRLELFSHCKHIESKLMKRAPDYNFEKMV